MKKAVLILFTVILSMLLTSCRGELFSGHRDMEHLRPVQAIGLDREGTAVTLSVSSGIGPEGAPPLVMRAAGPGIEAASARLQDWSPEDELFYAHVRYILLGESMADGEAPDAIATLLDWVERSPAMRMNTPLILIRGRADDAVTGSLGEKTDVTERLASLERFRAAQGGSLPTLRQVSASLLERGWALCLSAALFPDEGINLTASENAVAIVPAGLCLLRTEQGTTAADYLTQNESMGAELLTGAVVGAHVPAGDAELELIRGRAEASGVFGSDGSLTGIHIRCELLAGVIERGSDTPDAALSDALARAAEGWLHEAAAKEQRLGCDFLGLGDAVRRTAPNRQAGAMITADAVFSLPVTVTAEASIGRSYDLSE